MKLEKFMLPIVIGVIVILLYTIYFAPKDELGLFSDFDTNNNANREIQVKIVEEKGFERSQAIGATIFYVKDRVGTIVKVHGPLILPPGLELNSTVILRGHLHDEYFHAAEISIL